MWFLSSTCDYIQDINARNSDGGQVGSIRLSFAGFVQPLRFMGNAAYLAERCLCHP